MFHHDVDHDSITSFHTDFNIFIFFNSVIWIFAPRDSFFFFYRLFINKAPSSVFFFFFFCQGLCCCSDESSGVKLYLLRCPSPPLIYSHLRTRSPKCSLSVIPSWNAFNHGLYLVIIARGEATSMKLLKLFAQDGVQEQQDPGVKQTRSLTGCV